MNPFPSEGGTYLGCASKPNKCCHPDLVLMSLQKKDSQELDSWLQPQAITKAQQSEVVFCGYFGLLDQEFNSTKIHSLLTMFSENK